MPRKPRRPCSYPGCPELVEGRFCKEHEKENNKNYERYKTNPETHKRYSKAWKIIRKRYISEHPLCESCLKENRMTKAEHVHHIKPLSIGGTHDESNLMSLCKSCHSKIHAEIGDRFHHEKF